MLSLYALSIAGRRVAQFLLRGVREGLSGAAILDDLRKQGLGYRTDSFYRDRKVLMGYEEGWTDFRATPDWKRPAFVDYAPAKFKTPTAYLSRVKLTLRHRETGEVFEKHVSYGTDVRYSHRTLREKVKDWWSVKDKTDETEKWELVGVDPEMAFRKRGLME